MTKRSNIKHEIWEDGGGSIFWFVKKNGTPIRCFDGFEFQVPGSIRELLSSLAADPSAYTMWDGDAVESLRDEARCYDFLPYNKDCTAKSLYAEITADSDSDCLFTTDNGFIGNREQYASRLFADPAAVRLADAIRKTDCWDDCKSECDQLCSLAGMAEEWNAATSDWKSAGEEDFLPVLEKAAATLLVSFD